MRTTIVTLVIAFFCTSACAATEIDLLKDLPQKWGHGVKKEVKKHNDPKLGATANYIFRKDGKKLYFTVTLFDAGYGPIRRGLKSEVTFKAFENSIYDIRRLASRGYYRDLEKIERSRLKLSNGQHSLFAIFQFMVKVRGQQKLTQARSYLLVTGSSGYILKIRATSHEYPEANRNFIIHKISSLVEYLNKVE